MKKMFCLFLTFILIFNFCAYAQDYTSKELRIEIEKTSQSLELLKQKEEAIKNIKTLYKNEKNELIFLIDQELNNILIDKQRLQDKLSNCKFQLSLALYPVATITYKYLQSLGYNQYVCAGIMGNIMTESGHLSLDIQPKIISKNGKFYGICQWHKDYYIEVWGKNLQEQLNFLQSNIKNEFNTFGYLYKKGFNYLDFLNLTSIKETSKTFAIIYERCNSSSYELRYKCAQQAFKYFNDAGAETWK